MMVWRKHPPDLGAQFPSAYPCLHEENVPLVGGLP